MTHPGREQKTAPVGGQDFSPSAQEADPHRVAATAVVGGEQPQRFVIYWLDKGALPGSFLGDLNGYITGGSGRCLEAVEAAGAMIFEKVSDLADAAAPEATTASSVGTDNREAGGSAQKPLPETPVGWQDISTAPKDGTWIIAATRFGVVPVRWGLSWGDQHWANGCIVYDPTRWMHLPAPPVAAQPRTESQDE